MLLLLLLHGKDSITRQVVILRNQMFDAKRFGTQLDEEMEASSVPRHAPGDRASSKQLQDARGDSGSGRLLHLLGDGFSALCGSNTSETTIRSSEVPAADGLEELGGLGDPPLLLPGDVIPADRCRWKSRRFVV